MPIFYLDTSIIVKRYRPEKGTEVVDQLLENPNQEDRFYTSFLSVIELTSGILRLAKGGQLKENAATEVLARFRRDIRERFRIWPLNDDIAGAAITIVEQHRLRSADAIHLATAMAIFSMISSSESVMVSSDRELLDATIKSGFTILNPMDADSLNNLLHLRESQR